MKATCWMGKQKIEVVDVPDPKILNKRDAIVRVTSTAICGSDLHLYNGFNPAMEREEVRGGGWDLLTLQREVDQFVLHYDASGTSRQCFKILHDHRCLSVHFMLDLDGTIYQTLDLKERAWHASIANTRSIGIEIANIGAYATADPLKRWYRKDSKDRVYVSIPQSHQPSGIRTKNFVPRPIRSEKPNNFPLLQS